MCVDPMIRMLVLLFFIVACDVRQDARKEAVLEEYRRLKSDYEATEREACRSTILSLAETSVDSIILNLEIDPLKDTLYAPTIPDKPSFVPVDSAVFMDVPKSDTTL